MKKSLVILVSCLVGAQLAIANEKPTKQNVLKVERQTRLYNYSRNPITITTIPVFDFMNKSVKQGFDIRDVKETVPKLDLQSEPRIQAPASYTLGVGNFRALQVNDLPKLKQNESPTLKFDFTAAEPKPVREFSDEIPGFKEGEVVQLAMVESIKATLSTPPEIKLKPAQMEDPMERDFLTLAILYHERKSCPEVMPLGHYLKSKGYNKPEVDYFLGACQHSRKLYSESVPLLASVIKSGVDHYTHLAVEALLEDLPTGYDQVIAEALAPREVYRQLTQNQKDFYNYILAKGRFINGKFSDSSKLAEIVSPTSRYFKEAQYLFGVSEYMQNYPNNGIKVLTGLASALKPDTDAELYSLTQIALARFYFEVGKYNESMRAYESVQREHALWFDSLMEKGWSQIRLRKYPEAIGNMYTLHSPFFKSVFKPETYVIQTIGYLSMCQFGNADETLAILEGEYAAWKDQTKTYLGSNKSAYKTLMTYMSAKDSSKDVDNLPASVIREMGRDKEFLVLQKKLNNIIDEINFYQSAVQEIMTLRNRIKTDITGLEKDVEKLNNEVVKLEKQNRQERVQAKEAELTAKSQELILQNYRISLIDQGLSTYTNLTGNSRKRVMSIRDAYIKDAERILKGALANIDVRLEKVLKNNDLLRYEIYANSGKNIRYRAAGGQVSNRVPAKEIKKTKKDYGWSFKGEFWADEIGKFVANVPDLCPKK